MEDKQQALANVELAKRALVELRTLRAKLDEVERARTEPIALVGIGCRFPGGANDPEGLWRLLHEGVDAMRGVPSERWDGDAYHDPDPDTPGKTYTREAGFIDQVDRFDPLFFGISPLEAEGMDPQQRVLLEVAWEALEHAGQAPQGLRRTEVGVFFGIMTTDYQGIHAKARGLEGMNGYTPSATEFSVAAGRLSYVLGLQGPTMAVSTACSSSLVAVHLACQALRGGECHMALAGGVNLMLSPDTTVAESKARMLAADGRCKTFDARADGTARGEGCGVVVLKRLSDAVADGDNILALVRGSAVNHDGPSSSLTAPNGPSQQAVIRRALSSAKLTPADVSYVEAHGTGTPLGDPIEVGALSAVFGEKEGQLALGSIKTNFGHLEAAAGIAGLIKTVLALHHEEIPAHLHLEEFNPHISFEDSGVAVPSASLPWPSGTDRRRVAGLSSFGLSGTNAHVVLEEAPTPAEPEESPAQDEDRPEQVLTLSARSDAALAELAGRYAAYLAEHPEVSLAEVCRAAQTGRSHLERRAAVVASSVEQARERLELLASGEESPDVVRGEARRGDEPEVAFLFTGQGSQYVGMGRELYAAEPVFRAAMDRCAEVLKEYLDPPLLQVMHGDEAASELLDQTGYTQPALFSLEYALSELWRSWGLEPTYVLGHSVGELVAAVVAGVFDLEQGLRLVAERGRMMQALPEGGAMAAILTEEAKVVEALAAHGSDVSIAAVNGPESVVISGVAAAVDAVAEKFEEGGVQVRRLRVSHAFHSPLMEPMLDEFERVAQSVSYSSPKLTLISNVTGKVAGDEVCTAAYWRRHVREGVRFAAGMQALRAEGADVFVEVGSAPLLLGMGRFCVEDESELAWLPSLRRGQRERDQILRAVGGLYTAGVEVDWAAVDSGRARRRVSVPTYAFQRKRYWLDGGSTFARVAGPSVHPLLGARVVSSVLHLFEAGLSPEKPAFLVDHKIGGTVVMPGAAYVEMALAAATEVLGPEPKLVEGVMFQVPLVFTDDAARSVQVILTPESPTQMSFRVVSSRADRQQDEWTQHASGILQLADGAAPTESLDEIRQRCSEEVSVSEQHEQFEQTGLSYGPDFRRTLELWRGDGEVLARIASPDRLADGGPFQVFPGVLDACFQSIAATAGAASDDAEAREDPYIPIGIDAVRFHRKPAAALWCHTKLRGEGDSDDAQIGDIRLFDDEGAVAMELSGIALRRVSLQQLLADASESEPYYESAWQITDREEVPQADASGTWLVFTDKQGVGEQLAADLAAQGGRCITVAAADGATASVDDSPIRLDPGQLSGYADLLQKLEGEAIRGVIHLWSLDASAAADATLASGRALSSDSVLGLVQGLQGAKAPPELWVVTRGAAPAGEPRELALAQTPAWGLGRVIALEQPELRCRRVDLDPAGQGAPLAAPLLAEILAASTDDEIAFRGPLRYARRLVRWSGQRGTDARPWPFRLTLPAPGELHTELTPLKRPAPGPEQVEVEIVAAGLNFRDVLMALGMYPGDMEPLGGECAGRISAVGADVTDLAVGDEVVAMATGCFASHVVTPANLAARKPANMTFATAATVPIAYLTAYICLHKLGKLAAGKRVLIHGAAGGVGMVAVQLAQRVGAEIFGTTGSPHKVAFLESLGIDHVVDAQTTGFADEIKRLTNGEGVDIVLNSLADDYIPASLGLLKQGGVFVEIGKRGIWTHDQVKELRDDIAYHIFALDSMSRTDPAKANEELKELLGLFESEQLTPVPVQSFSIDDAVQAFRHMQLRKHVGKIALTVDDAPSGAIEIDEQGSYLITGGLGGLGLKVADWLVDHGARHLVLVSRSGAAKPAAKAAVEALEAKGAQVLAAAVDVSDTEAVRGLVADVASSEPPLRGVIHAAGVLDDAMLGEQNKERFDRVFAPKVAGAWNLHEATRETPLDFFVLFSSLASLFGSVGQAGYCAANAYLDALAAHRRALELPGLSINWGPWGEVGMAASADEGQARWAEMGIAEISPTQGLAAFEELVSSGRTQVGVMDINWPVLLQGIPEGHEPPAIATLVREERERQRASGVQSEEPEFLRQLAQVPPEEQREFLLMQIRELVAKVVGADDADLDDEQPLADLGMDSLTAVELRNALGRTVGRVVPQTIAFNYPTIRAITDYLADTMLGLPPSEASADAAEDEADQDIEDVEQLSDEEALALLEAELLGE